MPITNKIMKQRYPNAVRFELKNLLAVYGPDGWDDRYQKFWAKMIPRSIIEESLRYCEQFQSTSKLFGFTFNKQRFFGNESPTKAQITVYQLALTIFGDAVSGIDKEGCTVLKLDGHELQMTLILDTMGGGNADGSFFIYPNSDKESGMNAAASAATSVVAYLNEHRYEDRIYLQTPWLIRDFSWRKKPPMPDLPPGLDELDEDKLAPGSPRPRN